MKINGLILGNGTIVTDGRTLNAMERAGHFRRPCSFQPYVDEENSPRQFTFKGTPYIIRYFSGCFYPFVVKSEQN